MMACLSMAHSVPINVEFDIPTLSQDNVEKADVQAPGGQP